MTFLLLSLVIFEGVGSSGNPHGTPDSTAIFPKEIYYVDRKSAENRNPLSLSWLQRLISLCPSTKEAVHQPLSVGLQRPSVAMNRLLVRARQLMGQLQVFTANDEFQTVMR